MQAASRRRTISACKPPHSPTSIRQSPRRSTCRRECAFEAFQNLYRLAHRSGLKGATTYRPNPEFRTGVLVRQEELDNTVYTFTTDAGETVSLKGSEELVYGGETTQCCEPLPQAETGVGVALRRGVLHPPFFLPSRERPAADIQPGQAAALPCPTKHTHHPFSLEPVAPPIPLVREEQEGGLCAHSGRQLCGPEGCCCIPTSSRAL